MEMDAIQELEKYLNVAASDLVMQSEICSGELTVLTTKKSVEALMLFLRDNERYRFQTMIDLCGVDYPEREERFEVVYQLLSVTSNLRIRVKLSIGMDDIVPSIACIYSAAGWYEREAWDMYGILFSGHDDLRRILTDYGFSGHPMRKDFPLTGFQEVRYDGDKKAVIYEAVKLPQDFRSFDFTSPWEGTTYILPGDEKATK